jgi:DNA-binding protein YbaB
VYDDDPVERLAQWRDEADILAQKLEAVQAQEAEFTGSDRSGAVTVTISGPGHVRAVAVDRSWRTELGVGGLGAAVQEAVDAAVTARTAAWSEAFVEQDEAPDPRARPMPLTHETPAYQLNELATGNLTGSQRQAALEELLAMVEAIEQGVDGATAQIEAHLDARYTGRSRNGHVSVTVTGGAAVAEVRYDSRWLMEAHEININRETTEAFLAAYQRAGERTLADLVAQTPLGEVQALGQDPLGLARRLYLRED